MPAAAIEALVTEQLAVWLEAASLATDMDALAAKSAMAKAHWRPHSVVLSFLVSAAVNVSFWEGAGVPERPELGRKAAKPFLAYQQCLRGPGHN